MFGVQWLCSVAVVVVQASSLHEWPIGPYALTDVSKLGRYPKAA